MCTPHKTPFWLAPDGATHMPYTSTVEGMMRCALGLPFTGPTLAEPCNWVRMVRKTYVWCEQPCLPDPPPDLLRSKRNSEHQIHTPSPLFLQIWEGGWANEGGPAAKTQQKESLLTVYHAKTGCGACHCTYQVDPAIFNALEAKYKCKLKLQVNIFQFSSLPTNMSSCLTLTDL